MEQKEMKQVLAMYDVRGIQKYIFRTDKVKDAIGASYIVENIMEDALASAVDKVKRTKSLKVALEWYGNKGPFAYRDEEYDVQVAFIGGGNAYVIYSSEELAIEVNKYMSKYILDKTYSLQLAVAMVAVGENYNMDYQRIHEKMNKIKARMDMSKPLGALPVMREEVKTGYPMVDKENGQGTESLLKQAASYRKQQLDKTIKREERIFDNLVTKKGVDSQLAVVHLDGNNMGIRIRQLIQDKKTYKEAIDEMRKISYNINHSFKDAFDKMKKHFTQEWTVDGKENPYFIRKILVAGDDITYVCNAKIALATAEYYCKLISQYTMDQGYISKEELKDNSESITKYGFSVCVGVSFIGSHFPFRIGYNVAEELCSSAKKRAKKEKNKDQGRIGNFVDFHICKNIQAQQLKEMRTKEYVTATGEQLLRRPYYISTPSEGGLSKNAEKYYAWNQFKEAIIYFGKDKNIPRSFAKQLRNIYPQGANQTKLLISFLDSRQWKMPDDNTDMYVEEGGKTIAKWYDMLEMLDYYMDLDQMEEKING